MKPLQTPDWSGQALRCGVLLTALIMVTYASGISAMAAPFCATCTLLALMPKAPFSTPKTLFLSHLICIGIGASAVALPLPALATVLLAAWVSIMAMAWFRVVHAPAVAHTAILSLGKQSVESYVLVTIATALGFALFAYVLSLQEDAKKHAI
jgi:CBS-domain-containing membrane protein